MMTNGFPKWLNRIFDRHRPMGARRLTLMEVLEKRQMLSTVVARHLFYNNSAFDGRTAGADARDDGAIALDKVALGADQTATFANYSSFSRGINGIMVDLKWLPLQSDISANDFEFYVGNSPNGSLWNRAPDPISITVRRGAGKDGSDRVTILFSDNAIQKQWLQVVVRATAKTGLLEPDIFYFGSAVGETGNDANGTRVNGTDEILTRFNPRTLLNPAPITDPYDFNRDKKVDATDQLIARNNGTNLKTDLARLNATVASPVQPRVELLSPDSARLTWYDVSLEDRAYQIEASVNGGDFTVIDTVPRNATGALLKELERGAQYKFRIKALSGTDKTAWSDLELSLPAGGGSSEEECDRYYKISVDPMQLGELTYSATETVRFEQINPDIWISAASWQEAVYKGVRGTVNIVPTGGIAPYDFSIGDFGYQTSMVNAGPFQVGQADYLRDDWALQRFDLLNGQFGLSPTDKLLVVEDTWNTTNIDKDYDDLFWKLTVTEVQQPEAPFGLIATPLGYEKPGTDPNDPQFIGTDIQLTWQRGSADIDEQIIERSIDDGMTWTEVGRVDPDVTTYLERQLSFDRKYTYRVYSIDEEAEIYRTDETASATTFKEQPGVFYYKVSAPSNWVTGTPERTGSNGALSVAPDLIDKWIRANSAAEAVWKAVTGNTTFGADTYEFQRSGAYLLEQVSATQVKIKLESSFGTDTICSYDWDDYTATVNVTVSPIGVIGSSRARAGGNYVLTLDPNDNDIASWDVDWGHGTPVHYDIPAKLDQIQLPAHQFPEVIGEEVKVYNITVTANKVGGGTIQTVEKRIAVGNFIADAGGEEETTGGGSGSDHVTATTARRMVLTFFGEVYSTIKYEPYKGWKKGPDATEETRAGNDWDQASLLKQKIEAYFRHFGASHTPEMKYVYKVVEAPAANVVNWLGAKDELAALNILKAAGILAQTITTQNGTIWDYVAPGDDTPAPTGTISFWHAWLKVKPVGGGQPNDGWWELDPSFKYRQFNAAHADIAVNRPFSADDYNQIDIDGDDENNTALPLEWYEGELTKYIAITPQLKGRTSLADIVHDGPIIARQFNHPRVRNSDGKKIFDVPQFTEFRIAANSPDVLADTPTAVTVYGTQPINMAHRVYLRVEAGNGFQDHEFVIPEQGQGYIGIGSDFMPNPVFQNPTSYLHYKYKPYIEINGAGDHINSASFLMPGEMVAYGLMALRPGDASGPVSWGDSNLQSRQMVWMKPAYLRHALLIGAQQHSVESMMSVQRKLNTMAVNRSIRDKYQVPLLAMAGIRHAFEYEQQAKRIAGLTHTAYVQSEIDLGLVSTLTQTQIRYNDGLEESAAALQNPILLDRRDPTDDNEKNILTIDLAWRREALVPLANDVTASMRVNNARRLLGYTSSALEHAVIEEVLNARSVSTVKAFQWARVHHNLDLTFVQDATAAGGLFDPLPAGLDPDTAHAARQKIIQAVQDSKSQGVYVVDGLINFGGGSWSGLAWEEVYSDGRHDFLIMDNGGEAAHGGEADINEPVLSEAGQDQTNMSPYGSGVVNLYSGELTYTENDLSVANPVLPLEFTRYYDSSRLGTDIGFGAGWGHSFSDHLQLWQHEELDRGRRPWPKSAFNRGANRVLMVSGSGAAAEFRHISTVGDIDYYENPSGMYGLFKFDRSKGQYSYIEKDGSYRLFYVNPEQDTTIKFRLTEVGDRFGNKFSISYLAPTEETPVHTRGIQIDKVRFAKPGQDPVTSERYLRFQWDEHPGGTPTPLAGTIRSVLLYTKGIGDESAVARMRWEYGYSSVRTKVFFKGKAYRGEFLRTLARAHAPTQLEGGVTSDAAMSLPRRLETRYAYDDRSINGGKLKRVSRYVANLNAAGEEGDLRGEYEFEYYANGRVFAITDPEGHTEYYSYNLFSRKYGLPEQEEPRVYTANTAQYNRAAEETLTKYNSQGLSTLIVNPDGTRIAQGWEEYDKPDAPPVARNDPLKARHRVIWRQGEVGLYEIFYYDDDSIHDSDDRGLLMRHITGAWDFDSAGGTYESWRNAHGQTPKGIVTDMTYTSFGVAMDQATFIAPLTTTVEPGSTDQRVTENKYRANRTLEWTKDPQGNVTAFSWSSNGELIGKGLPRGTTINGSNEAETDWRFQVAYVNDALTGQVHQVLRKFSANSEQPITTTTYDSLGLGRVVSIDDETDTTGGTSRVTNREYDVRGRITKETVFGDALENLSATSTPAPNKALTTSYTYDGDWLTTVMTSPGNYDHPTKTTNYTYDKLGRRFTSTDLLTDAQTVTLYDALGNVALQVNPLGHRTVFYFDRRNRRSQTLYADNSYQQFAYDGAGRIVAAHAPSGFILDYRMNPVTSVTSVYNHEGLLESSTDKFGQTTTNQHNEFGEITTATTPLANGQNRIVQYEYDPLGRVTLEKHPSEGNLFLGTTYDAHGNVEKVERWDNDDPGNTKRTSVALYNLLDQKIWEGNAERSGPATLNGTRTVVVQLEGHGLSVGDRIWVRESTGPVPSEDILGLRYVTHVNSANAFSFKMDDDYSGNLTSITVSTAVVETEYDHAGRVLKVTDPRGFVTENTYDAAGRLIEKKMPAPDAQPAAEPATQGDQNKRPTVSYQYYADGTLARQLDPNFFTANGDGRSVTTYRYHYGHHQSEETFTEVYNATASFANFPTQQPTPTSKAILDAAGQTIATVDAKGNRTDIWVDRRGTQRRVVRPDPGATGSRPTSDTIVDAAGNVRASFRTDRAPTLNLFDSAGRMMVTQSFEVQELNQSGDKAIEIDNWVLDYIDPVNQNDAWLKIQVAADVEEGDFISLAGVLWSEYRTPVVSGFVDYSQTVHTRPETGELVSAAYRVGEVASGWIKIRLQAPAGHRLDVFFPSIEAQGPGIRPVLQKLKLLSESYTEYDGPVVSRTIDGAGFRRTFEYDNSDRLVRTYAAHLKKRDPLPGNEELLQETTYNAFGEVVEEASFAASFAQKARRTLTTYDRLGRVVKTEQVPESGGLGLISTIGYDAAGHVKWTTNARGNFEIGSEDPHAYARANIHSSTFEYDGLGRKVKQVLPDPDNIEGTNGPLAAPTSTYIYDAVGNLTRTNQSLAVKETEVETAEQRVAVSEYDKLNRVTSTAGGGRKADISISGIYATITLPNHGFQTGDYVLIYDGNGNVNGTRMIAAVNTPHEFVVETDNEPGGTPAFVTVLSGVVLNQYDANGNIHITRDPRGNNTEFVYDNLNRKTMEVHPDPGTGVNPRITYKYNNADDLTEVMDARGYVAAAGDKPNHTTLYTYDGMGRKIFEHSPDRNPDLAGAQRDVQRFAYNPKGELFLSWDQRGNMSEYRYDWAGRQTSARTGVGRVVEIQPGSGGKSSLRMVRTSIDGQEVDDNLSMNPIERQFLVFENAAGDRTALPVFMFDYLNTVQGDLPTGQLTYAASITTTKYDSLGNVIETADSYGSTTKFEYDSFNRKISQTLPDPDGDGPLPELKTSYGYDKLSNLTHTIDAKGNYEGWNVDENIHVSTSEYDALGRKTIVKGPDSNGGSSGGHIPETRYTYDALGNVVTTTAKRTNPGDDISLNIYDAFNRVVAAGRHVRNATIDVGAQVHWIDVQLKDHGAQEGDLVLLFSEDDSSLNGAYPVVHSASENVFSINIGRAASVSTGQPVSIACYATASGYDTNGNMVSTRDPRNNASFIEYDSLNRKVVEILPAIDHDNDDGTFDEHPTITYSYDENGNVIKMRDPLGNVGGAANDDHAVLTKYDAFNRPIEVQSQVVDGSRPTVKTFYDAAGNVSTTIDARGFTTSHSYDTLNNEWKTVLPDPDGASGPAGQSIVTNIHDPNGNLIYSINAKGYTASENDFEPIPKAHVSVYAFDALNREISVTGPDPDGAGTGQLGAQIRTGYDVLGNAAWTIDPLGNAQYDNNPTESQIQSMVSSHQHTQTFEYDDLNRRTRAYDIYPGTGSHLYTTFHYDEVGSLRMRTDAEGNQTVYDYDTLNRMTEERVDTLDGTVGGVDQTHEVTRKWDYDAAGNVKTYVNRNSDVMAYEYDALNRKTDETWTVGSDIVRTIAYEYDIKSRRTSATDDDSTHTYFYDNLDRLDVMWRSTPISAPSWLDYAYNFNGQPTSMTLHINDDATILEHFWAYDAQGQLVAHRQVAADAWSKQVDYAYDADGRRIEEKRYFVNEDESGTWSDGLTPPAFDGAPGVISSYEYDAAGRLATLLHKDANGDTITSYHGGDAAANTAPIGYDVKGRITDLYIAHPAGATDPEGKYDYTYDDKDQLTAVDAPQSAGDLSFMYDGEGNRTGNDYQNGADNRLNADGKYSYDYDKEGNLIARHEGGNDTIYIYDPANRLTDIDTPTTSSTAAPEVQLMHWGPEANWDTVDITYGGSTFYDIGLAGVSLSTALNSLSAIIAEGGVSVDDSGHRTAVITWNEVGNRDQIQVSGFIATEEDSTGYVAVETIEDGTSEDEVHTYTYDIEGRRLSRSVNFNDPNLPDIEERFYYDAEGRLLIVTDPDGIPINYYMHGAGVDEPISEETGDNDILTQFTWLLGDHLGSVRDVVDENGASLQHIVYDAFGNIISPKPGLVDTPAASVKNTGESVTAGDDDHWTVKVRGSSGTGSPAQEVTSIPWGLANGADFKWIAVDDVGSASSNTQYEYETAITVPAGAGSLAFDLGSDNALIDVEIVDNQGIARSAGISLGTAGTADPNTFNQWHSFTIHGLQSTDEKLRFIVENIGGPSGLLVRFNAEATQIVPRFMYTGQEYDVESNLTYMNARYYDSHSGRFISQDPIGFNGGYDNLYSYVGNNSINLTDPTGEFAFLAPLAIAALEAFTISSAITGWVAAAAAASDRFAGMLADFGGSLSDLTGIDSFTIPLGFGSISFGKKDGVESFGFGLGWNGAGAQMMVSESGGRHSVSWGPNVGFEVGKGFGVTAGVMFGNGGPTYSFGASWGRSYGNLALSVGPQFSVGPNGDVQSSIGASVGLPMRQLNTGGGRYGGVNANFGYSFNDNSVSVGAGAGFYKSAEGRWAPDYSLPWVSSTLIGGSGFSVSWNPFYWQMKEWGERVLPRMPEPGGGATRLGGTALIGDEVEEPPMYASIDGAKISGLSVYDRRSRKIGRRFAGADEAGGMQWDGVIYHNEDRISVNFYRKVSIFKEASWLFGWLPAYEDGYEFAGRVDFRKSNGDVIDNRHMYEKAYDEFGPERLRQIYSGFDQMGQYLATVADAVAEFNPLIVASEVAFAQSASGRQLEGWDRVRPVAQLTVSTGGSLLKLTSAAKPMSLGASVALLDDTIRADALLFLRKVAGTGKPVVPVVAERGGRITSVTALVTPKNLYGGTNVTNAARKAVVMGKNDDAGHIVARILGGRGDAASDNLASQLASLNRGAFRTHERWVARQVALGNKVEVDIKLRYFAGNKTMRPDEFVYTTFINGLKQPAKTFSNH